MRADKFAPSLYCSRSSRAESEMPVTAILSMLSSAQGGINDGSPCSRRIADVVLSFVAPFAPVVKRTSRRSPEPQVRVRFPAGAGKLAYANAAGPHSILRQILRHVR